MTEALATGSGALARGTLLGGRYRVEQDIGAGAMGEVYRVVHETLQVPFALKILHPELAVIPEVRQRLEREARLSAWLDHPSVVQVTDYGVHEGRPYLVMRLVEGEELAARLERGPVPPGEAIALGKALCEGLAHAHGLGLVHRDLKPENVVLSARGLRILDFGLARVLASDDPRLTRTGLVCGTPRYMSPEQASGDPIDIRSDIYAVGVLLHEMVRGAPMFDGPNAAAVLRRQIVDPPPPLAVPKTPGIDGNRLVAVIEKALAKDPAHRHRDALAMAEALERCRSGARAPARSAWVAVLSLGALVASTGVLAWMLARDPLVEARAALAAGQLSVARRSLESRIESADGDHRARLFLGHVAAKEGSFSEAVRAWSAALSGDPSLSADPTLLDELAPALAKSGKEAGPRADAIIETLAERAPREAVPLLSRLAEEAPSFWQRRRSFEGLERLDATDALDGFAVLARDLEANKTTACDLRRWYLERLLRLDEGRAEPLVAKERARRRACDF